ncbi:esterase-like activity of phytase family protein [Pseudomonas sp. MAP12]|uniref:Esterase-like activity of phytase family protein n=1 Tax=Geopseudomonas aromaticivorans TaxID=2849492 RepID=A0ABS6MZ19_9GAMM|nr:esterase-like activity of phytase family protein [Pseudomonas aromaticivorans]MBV2133639.1 esterase-like activity of phytase family protein [Pseudomonas aromaticivorans]
MRQRWHPLARLLAALLLVGSALARAEPLEELALQAALPVDGMATGNLSGLARCGDGAFWAVSDREDDRLYRLQPAAQQWQAEAQAFVAPPPPPSALPWGLRVGKRLLAPLRGGALDFEGLSCDALGNRYLLSESEVAVLALPAAAPPHWLALPPQLLRQARARGLLLHFNALLEGLAVQSDGQRLWLAAERESRGLLAVQRSGESWRCAGNGCVLLAQGGRAQRPLDSPGSPPQALDFTALSWHAGRLYSLERLQHRICRRDPHSGAAQRCWSFAAAALAPERRYDTPYGMAEALWLDDGAAWIGLDNNGAANAAGERRPVILQLAAPAGGWNGRG